MSIKQFHLTQWQRGASFYLLYMIILFKFEVAILKIICNMASSNINLTLKDDPPFSLTLTSILLSTHNEKQFACPLKSSLKLTASCKNGHK